MARGPIKRFFSSLRYKIRKIFGPYWYRFFGYKHHIIKTSLEPAVWYDTDTRILYAVMDTVKWYVDNDMRDPWTKAGLEAEIARIKNEGNPEYQKDEIAQVRSSYEADLAAIEIAKWWENYPNREKEIALEKKSEKANQMEDQLIKEEQEMLIKAINYRRTMWS